jgi:hypothetical protein
MDTNCGHQGNALPENGTPSIEKRIKRLSWLTFSNLFVACAWIAILPWGLFTLMIVIYVWSGCSVQIGDYAACLFALNVFAALTGAVLYSIPKKINRFLLT